jgi:hypothetical protein
VWELDELGLQTLQVVVIEVKPVLKAPDRTLGLELEEVGDLGQAFIIRHMRSSTTLQPLSLLRCRS